MFGFCFIIFVCLQLSAQEKMKKRMQMMLNKQRKTLNRWCLWLLLIKISIFLFGLSQWTIYAKKRASYYKADEKRNEFSTGAKRGK